MTIFPDIFWLSASFAGLFVACTFASAQSSADVSSYWQKIRGAESAIRQIEVTWLDTFSMYGNSSIDAAKSKAMSAEQSRLHAETPQQAAAWQAVDNSMIEHAAHGKTWHSRLTFLSDGKTTRADVLNSIDDADKQTAHYIDVFDGTNNIYVIGVGTQTPTYGELTRDPKEKLSFSAAGPVRPIFLFGSPIEEIFTPEQTVITEGTGNTIILEHMLPYKYPMLARMTISKTHWRPTELVVSNPGNHRVHTRYTLNKYQQHTDGVWFPSHIMELNTNEAGMKVSTSEYTMESIRLNADVDTSLLDPPVPRGTNITDFRFGRDVRIPGYRVVTHIPTDDWVLKTMGRQKAFNVQLPKEAKRQRYRTNALAVVVSVGMFTILRIRWRKKSRKA